MKARSLLCFLLLFVVSTAFAVMEVRLETDDRLQLSFKLDEYTIVESDTYSQINIDNLMWDSPAGTPEIPYYEFNVAVPKDGDIAVSLTTLQTETANLTLPLRPAPEVRRGKEVSEYHYEMSENYGQYQGDIRIDKGEYTEYRRSAFVPVRLYPISYNASSNTLDIGIKFDININILGNTRAKNNHTAKEANRISHLVVNSGSAKSWKLPREESDINFIDWSLSNHWYKFSTSEQGIMEITASDLSELPLDDIDPRTIRIHSTGGKMLSYQVDEMGYQLEEIPILIEGEDDGSFDSSDRIILYVEGRDLTRKNLALGQSYYKNPYSSDTVYWLTFGGSFPEAPKRLSYLPTYSTEDIERTFTSYPFKVRRENERQRRTQMGFEWYDYLMSGSSSATYDFNLNAEDVSAEQGVYKRFEMSVRETDSDFNASTHRMDVDFNNETIATLTWLGASAKFVSVVNFTPVSGSNAIELTVNRSGSDDILLDYINMTYYRDLIKRSGKQYKLSIMDFDENQVTDFRFTKDNSEDVFVLQADDFNKAWLVHHEMDGNDFNFIANCTQVGGEYTEETEYIIASPDDFIEPGAIEAYYPEDLSVAEAVDYLIITPQEFFNQADRLAQIYSNNRNLNCKVVTMERVIDQFNGGMDDPGAIRTYIYHVDRVNPSSEDMSVVLIGSSTYDWRNNSGGAADKNKMLMYQEGSVASDDYFVMLRQNARPELPIGRIPAQNEQQLELQIDRIEEWNTSINPGWWRDTVLFLADDDENGEASGEYSHTRQVQEASEVINRSVLVEKIYAIDYEMDEYKKKPQVKNKFVEEINEGALIWYYVGHGSYDKLGTEDYFSAITDIDKLDNTDKLNLFIAASCDVGQFDSYNFDSLGEQLLFADNGGAIATISATRECYGNQNTSLIEFFFIHNCNERLSIGESLMLAKAQSSYASNDKKYILLGDPLLHIVPPAVDNSVTTSSVDGIFNSREKIVLEGQFINSLSNGVAEFRAIDNDKFSVMPDLNQYAVNGLPYYNGEVSVKDGEYESTFIIPDDISNGELGRTLAYFYDETQKMDFVSVLTPISYSDDHVQVTDTTPPVAEIWIDNESFQTGDSVSKEPLFHATISDESGVNTLGAPGHKILLDLDDNSALYDFTDHFIYDTDSYQQGTLEVTLTDLEPGYHRATLIVFDNYNNPSVTTVDFETTDQKGYALHDFLPYPNPMPKSGGDFTFRVNELSDYTIKIYTISGKKIRTLKGFGNGFIQVPWNGRDDRGSKLANNTYFLKLKTKSRFTNKSLEKTQKLVIFDK